MICSSIGLKATGLSKHLFESFSSGVCMQGIHMSSILFSRWFRVLVQAGLFIAVAYWYLSVTDWREVVASVWNFPVLHVLLAMIIMALRPLTLGMKWYLSMDQTALSWPWFLRNEWHILFLEFAIPVPDAEDLLRVSLMRAKDVPWSVGLRAVFLMRMSGVFIVSTLVLLLVLRQGHEMLGARPATGYAILAMLMLFCLTFVRPFLLWAVRILRCLPFVGESLARTVREALSNPVGSVLFTGLSVITILHMSAQAAVVYVLLQGIGHHVAFFDLLLLTPLLTLSFLLPLSIQGLGLPEATMVLLLPFFGVQETAATAVAAVHLACYVIMIATGGVLFACDGETGIHEMFQRMKTSFKENMDAEGGTVDA